MIWLDEPIFLLNQIGVNIEPPPEFSEERITQDSISRLCENGNVRITEGI